MPDKPHNWEDEPPKLLTDDDVIAILRQGPGGAVFLALMTQPGTLRHCAPAIPFFGTPGMADTFQRNCIIYYIHDRN